LSDEQNGEHEKSKTNRSFDYILSALVFVVSAIAASKSSKNESEQNTNDASYQIARWTAVVARWTRWLVIVGVITGGVLALQAVTLINQLDEMRNDQRPWIGLDGIVSAGNGTYIVTIINGGKSPAMKVNVVFDGGAGDCSKFSIPHQICEGDKCSLRNMVLLPLLKYGGRIPRLQDPLVLSGQDVCIIVRADYQDVAGSPHKTGICLIYNSVSVRSCREPDSNYAD